MACNHCWHAVYGKGDILHALMDGMERCCLCGELRERVLDIEYAGDVAWAGPWEDYGFQGD